MSTNRDTLSLLHERLFPDAQIVAVEIDWCRPHQTASTAVMPETRINLWRMAAFLHRAVRVNKGAANDGLL